MKTKRPYRKTPARIMKGGDILNNSEFDHVEPVQAQYLEVKVHFGNFDKAMSAFRNMVQKERILSSYKEKQVFEKPSDKKRRKRNEMKRKLLELEMKDKYEERSDSKNTRNKQTRE